MTTVIYLDGSGKANEIEISDVDAARSLIATVMDAFGLEGTVFNKSDVEEVVEREITDDDFMYLTNDFYDDVVRLFESA